MFPQRLCKALFHPEGVQPPYPGGGWGGPLGPGVWVLRQGVLLEYGVPIEQSLYLAVGICTPLYPTIPGEQHLKKLASAHEAESSLADLLDLQFHTPPCPLRFL